MKSSDKQIADKLLLLSIADANAYGIYLLGFVEALKLMDFNVDTGAVKALISEALQK